MDELKNTESQEPPTVNGFFIDGDGYLNRKNRDGSVTKWSLLANEEQNCFSIPVNILVSPEGAYSLFITDKKGKVKYIANKESQTLDSLKYRLRKGVKYHFIPRGIHTPEVTEEIKKFLRHELCIYHFMPNPFVKGVYIVSDELIEKMEISFTKKGLDVLKARMEFISNKFFIFENIYDIEEEKRKKMNKMRQFEVELAQLIKKHNAELSVISIDQNILHVGFKPNDEWKPNGVLNLQSNHEMCISLDLLNSSEAIPVMTYEEVSPAPPYGVIEETVMVEKKWFYKNGEAEAAQDEWYFYGTDQKIGEGWEIAKTIFNDTSGSPILAVAKRRIEAKTEN